MFCMPVQAHGSRSGNTSLRRLVVERDHGICSQQGCRRDCLSLVSRLKSVKDRQVMDDSSHDRQRFLECYELPYFCASMSTTGRWHVHGFGRGRAATGSTNCFACRMDACGFLRVYIYLHLLPLVGMSNQSRCALVRDTPIAIIIANTCEYAAVRCRHLTALLSITSTLEL